MRKKLLLVAGVCLAVLVIAAGAYGYVLFSEVSSLRGRLDDLQRTVDLLKIDRSEYFNFFWESPVAEKFNVTTFWMNVTFQRINQTHLIITAKVNDLNSTHGQWSHEDYLGIVFDSNRDGQLDGKDDGEQYFPYNASRPFLLGDYGDGATRFLGMIAQTISDNTHKTYFDPEFGYEFVIPVNLQKLKLTNDLVHIEYSHTVSVEFCFGMELIT